MAKTAPRSDLDTVDLPPGVRLLREYLDAHRQACLYAEIERVVDAAPFYFNCMPRTGRPFAVAMTNCGPLGWVSDRSRGYRYQATHPLTGERWPDIPQMLLDLWSGVTGFAWPPEACLVNLYRDGARLGSHVDRDEADLTAPVVSVSLGDDAVFHVGGVRRNDPKSRTLLKSGDVLTLHGPARLAYHGVDRVRPGTSDLVPGGGRINLTLRRVNPA